MGRARRLGLFAAVTLAAVAIAVWVARPPAPAFQGGPLLPDFAARAGATERIVIQAPDATVTLVRRDGAYRVAEKDDYPARGEEVKKLLLGLAGLKRLEAKTSQPANYAALELADPGSPSGSATRIVVYADGDRVLAEVLLGQRRAARADPLDSEYFVRLPGDPQVWLVEGRLPDRDHPIDWVDSSLLKLDLGRIARVRVRHADGAELVVHRDSSEAADYVLEGVPPGKKIESQPVVNNVATTMASLSFEDVRRAAQPAPGPPAFESQLRTFDGLVVDMSARERDKRVWVRLRASADPAQSKGKEGSAEPAAEVAKLNARWQGWSYAIAPYQVDALRKRVADLLAAPKQAAPARP